MFSTGPAEPSGQLTDQTNNVCPGQTKVGAPDLWSEDQLSEYAQSGG